MLQGVALGRKRKSNNLLLSESTASPTTRRTRTSSTCKESQNKFKNLCLRKKFLKDDSPKDNILSDQAAKKILEASNCELHEIQQRTNKVHCQHCYSYIEAGFQVCSCGGQLDMSEEMLSSIRQKIKQLIADAFLTFRGARHGAQPCQKHHFLAKEFMRKIGKKGIYSSMHNRFRNDEVLHASQLQHNWTKEWCEYLDYIKTVDVSHKASPEQLERYATLYHFRYDPKQMERGPIKSRPDDHQTTLAIVSMNKEAGQTQESKTRRNYREDLDPEKFDWLTSQWTDTQI